VESIPIPHNLRNHLRYKQAIQCFNTIYSLETYIRKVNRMRSTHTEIILYTIATFRTLRNALKEMNIYDYALYKIYTEYHLQHISKALSEC
jgi:hypothetical protein